MSSTLPLQIDRSSQEAVYTQIENHYAEAIRSGRFPADMALPNTVDLASQLGVNPLTVRRAYQRLSEAGLVKALRGKGTFVQAPARRPTLGLAISLEFFLDPRTVGFHAAVAQRLDSLVQDSDYQFKIILLTTPYAEQCKGALNAHDQEQLREPSLRGVYAVGARLPEPVWKALREREIATVAWGDGYADARVEEDLDHRVRSALNYVKACGRHHPGIIYYESNPHGSDTSRAWFSRVLQECGFPSGRAHIVGLSHTTHSAGRFASECLFNLTPKIDSIVCLDDTFAQGVCNACHIHGMNVPKDLLVVTAFNQGVTPQLSLPVAKLVVDVDHFVQLAHQMMVCLLRAEPVEGLPSILRARLIPENIPADAGFQFAVATV